MGQGNMVLWNLKVNFFFSLFDWFHCFGFNRLPIKHECGHLEGLLLKHTRR